MNKYYVWSTHRETDDTPEHDVLELTRTDEKVAREDVGIITDILHRKAWITKDAT